MKISRQMYLIVRNGNEILVGQKNNLRFIPADALKSTYRVVLYGTMKTAKTAIENSVNLQSMLGRGDRIAILPAEETLETAA